VSTARPLEAIRSVLVANRGEIVARVCRTLRALGIRSVAVFAPDDADAVHTRVADEAVAVDSYLDLDSIVAAAKAVRADAVHPGYGFLSEDPAFARAVAGAGIVWVGPPPEAIEAMGDKIQAKATVAAAGVPVVPGAGRPGMDDDALAAAALELGLPVLLKPAAGGGGKGMRRVADAQDLRAEISAARREAEGAFGDPTLLVERWIERPRHIEVQVFADAMGNVVHLGERECTLQRRHQKIIEETPSPALDASTRAAMTRSALDVASACGYVGAGTVEFIVPGDHPDQYFFMEMNTRLQVEHPVTEEVMGVDLVEWQLRVAAREPLPVLQAALSPSGHAVEARVYAEDPARGFLPATGSVVRVEEPAGRPHVRIDAALDQHSAIGTRYDPMLAKVIAWGRTRAEALARLRAALEDMAVLGVTTNVGYLTRLLAHPDVVAGRLDTGLVERTLAELAWPREADARGALVAAACEVACDLEPAGPFIDPWEVPDAWSVAGPREWTIALVQRGRRLAVHLRGRVRDRADVRVGEGPSRQVRAKTEAGGARLVVSVDGSSARWCTAIRGDEVWVARRGDAWRFVVERFARGERSRAAAASGPVTAPMPGVVVAVHVRVGERVRAGQPLLALEAMKMEHAVAAPVDGVVTELFVRAGQSVGIDVPLARVETPGERDEDGERAKMEGGAD
jgi:acetyl-CoA/propionyl-CoA carboxylase biotin carboxyl carrier protein